MRLEFLILIIATFSRTVQAGNVSQVKSSRDQYWFSRSFNIFIIDLDDRIESTITKLARNTKLGGEVDVSDISQENLDRLKEWARKNSMKFNTDKCKVLHLGRNSQKEQYSLGSVQLQSSLAERDLRLGLNNKLNMGQQGTTAAMRANRFLG